MKKTLRFSALILAAALTVSGSALPAEAAGRNSMKYAKEVSWDLKKGKAVSFRTVFAHIGARKLKAKVTKWTRKTNKDGSRSLEVKIRITQPLSLTASQVHRMANSSFCRKYRQVCAPFYYAVLDYGTGLSLEVPNRFGVTVTPAPDDVKVLKTRRFRDKHGCYVSLHDLQYHFHIRCPASYTGLCVGIGGRTKLELKNKKVEEFFDGKHSFVKAATLYRHSGGNTAHFIRVK